MKNCKSFRYKFNTLTWVLLIILLAITLAGVGLNVYRVVLLARGDNTTKLITTAIMLAICFLLTVFTISIISYSKYVVKNGCVYSYFGFMKSKTSASEIVQFTHFKKSDKLVAYFTDEKFTVVIISPKDYDEFIVAVRQLNPKAFFSTQIDGEDNPES